MGMIARHGVKKSARTAWFEFVEGFELHLRYVNPDEREKLFEAANEKVFDTKKGETVERINTSKLAAKIRELEVIQDWKLKGSVLPDIIDLSEYPAPEVEVPFDLDDCEHLVRYGEGLGMWLLGKIRALSEFSAAEAARRKNASAPSPDSNSRLPAAEAAS